MLRLGDRSWSRRRSSRGTNPHRRSSSEGGNVRFSDRTRTPRESPTSIACSNVMSHYPKNTAWDSGFLRPKAHSQRRMRSNFPTSIGCSLLCTSTSVLPSLTLTKRSFQQTAPRSKRSKFIHSMRDKLLPIATPCRLAIGPIGMRTTEQTQPIPVRRSMATKSGSHAMADPSPFEQPFFLLPRFRPTTARRGDYVDGKK